MAERSEDIDALRLVRRVREYEVDHAPNGWPAVEMKFLSEMADALEYWIGQSETQRKCKLAAHDRLDQAYDALFSSPNSVISETAKDKSD